MVVSFQLPSYFFTSHTLYSLPKFFYLYSSTNGVERKHRHIVDMARSFRFQACLPLRFWGECVTTTVYLINRLPFSVLQGETHYDLLYQVSPILDHIRVFGCLVFATEVRGVDKFAYAVLLGYSTLQKGYKLYDLTTKTSFVSRDVVFKEEVFPFKHMSSSCPSLFLGLQFVDEPTCLPPIGTGDIITPATADSLECPSVDTQSSSIVSLVGEKVLVEPPDSSDAVSAIAPTSSFLRRSTKTIKSPIWLHDFHTS